MPLTGDIVMTVFAVQGIGPLVSAYARLGNAQQQAVKAETLYNAASAGSAAKDEARQKMLLANRALLQSHAATLTANATAFAALVFAGERAVAALTNYGREMQNIKDITGATAQESARALAIFKTSGMSDITEVREMLKLNQAVFSSQGKAALSMLGVAPNPNQSGFQLMLEVVKALKTMPEGLRRTNLIEQIYGVRGAAAMLQMIRLTDEQIESSIRLADSFDTEMLPALQNYQAQVALLGQVWQMKVVFPIAQILIPILEKVVGFAGAFFEATGQYGAIAVAVLGIAFAFTRVIASMRIASMMLMILRANAVAAAAATTAATGATAGAAGGAATGGRLGAMLGPWGALIGAVVGGTAAWFLSSRGGDDDKTKPALEQKFPKAVDRFESAVMRMESAFEDLKGNGIPGGLGATDIGSLQRQMALGIIG